MKRNLCQIGLGVALVLLFTAMQSPAQVTRITTSIPFDFNVGSEKMLAGNYVVDVPTIRGGFVRIGALHGNTYTMHLTSPFRGNKGARLVFNQCGTDYYLSEVYDRAGNGQRLGKSKGEMECLRRAGASKQVELPTARR